MRLGVPFVLCVLLLQMGCGEGDTPSAPEPQPPAEPAAEEPVEEPKPPAEPAPKEPEPSSPPAEAPAQPPADHEDYVPPPNWCGTPGMGWKPRPKGGFKAEWVLVNDQGEIRRIPLSEITIEKLEELHKQGWKVRLRTRPK